MFDTRSTLKETVVRQRVSKIILAVLVSVAGVVGAGATAQAEDPGWDAPVVNIVDPTPTPTAVNDPGWD